MGYSCSEITGVDVRALSESAGEVVGNEQGKRPGDLEMLPLLLSKE